ncbi:hypothetical protein RESH_02064 [Rhodopirellula europaea SH398]|uniref:Uncharacterized protein n=1 Tax=Rhodopirellula europaea SH398 TaxID=1263868 RepID=M5SI10_9BACT|nr:hypothetical protein RESH_02064 [Rhodopirellula europaea SH398]
MSLYSVPKHLSFVNVEFWCVRIDSETYTWCKKHCGWATDASPLQSQRSDAGLSHSVTRKDSPYSVQ